MKKKDTVKVLQRIEPMVRAILGLSDLPIKVLIKLSNKKNNDDDLYSGLCYHQDEYNESEIHIFYNIIEDEKELKSVICHELCHVFLGKYTRYRDSVNSSIDDNDILKKVLDEGFRQADEDVTSKLSNVLIRILKNY